MEKTKKTIKEAGKKTATPKKEKIKNIKVETEIKTEEVSKAETILKEFNENKEEFEKKINNPDIQKEEANAEITKEIEKLNEFEDKLNENIENIEKELSEGQKNACNHIFKTKYWNGVSTGWEV